MDTNLSGMLLLPDNILSEYKKYELWTLQIIDKKLIPIKLADNKLVISSIERKKRRR